MDQPNNKIAMTIYRANVACCSLEKAVGRAKQAFELFGIRMTAAFNPMNRYRWPGKGKQA